MFEVTVLYFNDCKGVTPIKVDVAAGSKREALKIALKEYENKEVPSGLVLAGVVAL
jgi:hypothetical protein